MQLLRVACVLSAAHAFVAPHVARQPRHAMRGAPEDAADAKIDSFVKDNKVVVGVQGDVRPLDAIDATHAGHALHEGHEDLPPVRF